MNFVNLYRLKTSDQGTLGLWQTEGFHCRSIELPWRNNEQNYSCIPEGIYFCYLRRSKKFGICYHIIGIDNRTWILTHSGNLAGDRKKGYRSHSYGCILLGKYFGILGKQTAVLVSKTTLNKFIRFMGGKNFRLKISEVF